MKNYIVTLSLVIGYYNDDLEVPRLKFVDYEVTATSESEAISKAKQMDKTSYSVFESQVSEK